MGDEVRKFVKLGQCIEKSIGFNTSQHSNPDNFHFLQLKDLFLYLPFRLHGHKYFGHYLLLSQTGL